MEIRLTARVYVNKPEDLKGVRHNVVAFTTNKHGFKSKFVSISIKDEDDSNNAFALFELNKNQARYLRDFLNAFVEESDINLNDRD
jgi:hypothetical protein